MTRRSTVVLVAVLLSGIQSPSFAAGPELSAVSGNIVVSENGQTRELTRSGRDDEPVLARDGQWVIYTRKGPRPAKDDGETCLSGDGADEIRRVRLDGSQDERLVKGHAGKDVKIQLCGFNAKQFSSDGRRLYFLSPAWATSAAVHVLDMQTGKVKYLMPGNDLFVVNDCKGEHRDRLIVQQHRYLQFGGSYDWWWLFEPTGKEIAPVGDHDSAEAVRTMLNDSGQCAR